GRRPAPDRGTGRRRSARPTPAARTSEWGRSRTARGSRRRCRGCSSSGGHRGTSFRWCRPGSGPRRQGSETPRRGGRTTRSASGTGCSGSRRWRSRPPGTPIQGWDGLPPGAPVPGSSARLPGGSAPGKNERTPLHSLHRRSSCRETARASASGTDLPPSSVPPGLFPGLAAASGGDARGLKERQHSHSPAEEHCHGLYGTTHFLAGGGAACSLLPDYSRSDLPEEAMRKSSRKRTKSVHRPVKTTLGELIVAAFDTVGNEGKDVARLLSSREIGRAAHRRIVLVQ